MIQGVRVDISPRTMRRFLYRPEYQATINTGDMDYRIVEMRNVTNRTTGTENKLMMFR